MSGAGSVAFRVRDPSGKGVGTFNLCPSALCSELKQKIAVAAGPPPVCQKLVVGDAQIPDDQPLASLGKDAQAASVDVTLLVEIPQSEQKMMKAWRIMSGSSSFLEDLQIQTQEAKLKDDKEKRQRVLDGEADIPDFYTARTSVPAPGIGCIGLDPDSGLLVLVGGGIRKFEEDQEQNADQENEEDCGGNADEGDNDGETPDGNGEARGEGAYETDVAGDSGKDNDAGQDAVGMKGKGKGGYGDGDATGHEDEDNADDGVGEGRDAGKGKGKGNGEGNCQIAVTVKNCLMIVPSDRDPIPVVLEGDHPLVTAVEIHVAASLQGYPLPSLGLGVALVTGSRKVKDGPQFYQDGQDLAQGRICGTSSLFNLQTGPLTLGAFELCPALVQWMPLVADTAIDSEAVCLDRSSQDPVAVSVEVRPGQGRFVVFRQLRTCASQMHIDEFCISSDTSPPKRVTSIAWSPASSAILLTFAGFHAISVYRKNGGTWQVVSTLGVPLQRGCADGPAADLRFWFPTSQQRLEDFGRGLGKDSCPLVPGPSGAIYVYSGGVLMELASNLTSALKVSSMREELFVTDEDEGTPQFPTSNNVFGVHDGKVYRSLARTDWRGETIIRRLQMSDELRQGRSRIRSVAPKLWPNLNEGKTWDASEKPDYFGARPSLMPTYYHEDDRDRWDGSTRWLAETWLWEGSPTKPADNVRVTPGRELTTFETWWERQLWEGPRGRLQREADEALENRKESAPAELQHPNHACLLERVDYVDSECCDVCQGKGDMAEAGSDGWGYECQNELCADDGFRVCALCAVPEELALRTKQVAQWIEDGKKQFDEECKPLL